MRRIHMAAERKTLTQLFVPICFETLFYMLSGMVDTLMLSSVSDQAVGAVGTANTYIGVFIIMFGVISSGMVAVMTQNIGAGRTGIAYQARQLGLAFNAVIGILMSVFLAAFSGKILRIVSIAPALQEPAEIYLKIVGGACFLNALIPIFSSYLRVFGYTKHSLIGTIVGNVLNIVLNSVFLFVLNWGVMGVAVATVISRVVNLIIVAAMGAVLIKAKQSPERMSAGKILGQIIKIGFPSACETALYNVAMTLIVRFMNQMDANGMNVAARSYTMQIANFSYCVGAALAQANAIMTGWRIGAKEYDECDKGTRKAVIYGLITATCFSVTFAVLGQFIIHIFTDDVQMIKLVEKLLIVDIFLEFGRVTNLVYGQALKTSGDALFPVVMGAIFMYLFAVGGTYFLGIHLGLLAVGAYIAMAGDECARAVGMVLRWKSGKWKNKSLLES
jgi:putative MATE family efflux protein